MNVCFLIIVPTVQIYAYGRYVKKYLFTYLYIICLFIYVLIYLFIYLFIYFSANASMVIISVVQCSISKRYG